MSAAPILEVRDLTIRLPAGADRAYAVEGVSFSVNAGEIVCLVGESGSGKSVISLSAMGLLDKALRIETGAISLQGENIAAASEARLRELRCSRMGMIFQEPMTALNPVMRCGAQIDEVLREHTELSSRERKAKIIDMIREVRLPDPERMYASFPHQLSGGQRQRVMIAIALILEPALLIADEPTTALDVTTQAQILKLIREMQRAKDAGVLFITHDFGVVAEIADRVAVLRRGKLVEVGPAADVLIRPTQAYTRLLIDAVPAREPPARAPIAASEPVALKTVNLAKSYHSLSLLGAKHAVVAATGVNIEIRRGQTVGIVGESGSGKSTVARCVARLIDPSGGEVWIGGEDFAHARKDRLLAMRRKVQMIFQDPYRSLNPRRTVGESIIEGSMNYGLSRDAALRRALDLLEVLRLEPSALHRYPHEFSGGQRQRICIARALAMEPELLIADEAVSALDVSVQAQVLRLLEDIRHSLNLAVLFITHDLRVAAQVCDLVAVMSKGRVVEIGDAAQIFSAPRHEYTRALLDAAPGRFGFAAAMLGQERSSREFRSTPL
jgi:peptide/nickel transport system ATP-binding protein